MASADHVRDLYSRYTFESEVSVIEGVMGLFDGAVKMQGSSAEVAENVGVKVLLIINAKAVAYSVAPLIYGFKNFYKRIDIAGVVFNFVSSESHYSFLKAACEDVGVEALGYIPKNPELEIPSRHLGLSIDNMTQYDEFADRVADIIEQTVDVARITEIYNSDEPGYSRKTGDIELNPRLKIAVARDEAFNFIYHENISVLNEIGEVIYFSPLNDVELPEADIVYLAGGYPEMFLNKLADNISMKTSIKEYCNRGGRLLAECGGMMYLCNNIIDKEGNVFPMCGFLNQDASMVDMKLHLGYRKIMLDKKELKGHEFHYSQIVNNSEIPTLGEIYSARNKKLDTKIFKCNNVIASYIHFYWGETGIQTLWE